VRRAVRGDLFEVVQHSRQARLPVSLLEPDRKMTVAEERIEARGR